MLSPPPSPPAKDVLRQNGYVHSSVKEEIRKYASPLPSNCSKKCPDKPKRKVRESTLVPGHGMVAQKLVFK